MNVSAGADDRQTWREPKDDVIQIGKQRISRTEEVSHRPSTFSGVHAENPR